MAQELHNIQQQEQRQELRQQHQLKAQQVLFMRLLEMPLAKFEQTVGDEVNENPAIDSDSDISEVSDGAEYSDATEYSDDSDDNDGYDELDRVLNEMSQDDSLPTSDYASANNHSADEEREERVWGAADSFYDQLAQQVSEYELTERQQLIMDYLIGSLDDDGLLRKDPASLSDSIAIHEYIDVSTDEVVKVINILQRFDPPGIGALSLQQCLQIQILRMPDTRLTKLMHQVVTDYWDDFSHRRLQRIATEMQMSEATAEEVFDAIRRLNPRPGASLGETVGRSTEQMTPDYVVSVDDEENISFVITKGKVPELSVSREFEGLVDTYRQNPTSMTRTDKEALLYAQQKLNRARSFIEAIRQRQNTMRLVMQEIIRLQKDYILSGNDSDLRPMILKDVAERVGIDITTVSRVTSTKYAQLPWGTILLKDFFSSRVSVGGGEEVSNREIREALRNIISQEPKGKPYSDMHLSALLKEQGYPIARRTVAKYREKLGIPPASMRKGT